MSFPHVFLIIWIKFKLGGNDYCLESYDRKTGDIKTLYEAVSEHDIEDLTVINNYAFFKDDDDFRNDDDIIQFNLLSGEKKNIGQGNFAKACKCKNKNSNKLYAVKIIDKTVLKPKDLELIHQKRRYLNLIKHPNIIGLKDYFEDKKFMYLVTEYCSGGDLITFLEKNPKISEKTAAKIVRKIAEGIRYLNIFGIIHRDIKPENILFSEDNDIKSLKIIDLGVCKTLTYGQMASEPIGTNGYISPEIYMHQEYSFKTDVWSLGIILYLLITQGILPFDNENMDNKVIGKKVIYLQQEYPDEYFGKCSKSLMNLLDKMLEKNMEKRIDINSLLKDNWFNIIKKQN